MNNLSKFSLHISYLGLPQCAAHLAKNTTEYYLRAAYSEQMFSQYHRVLM